MGEKECRAPVNLGVQQISTTSHYLFLLSYLILLPLFFQTNIALADTLAQPQKVLLLHSYHHGNKWTDDETKGVIEVLGENRPGFQLDIEYMDTKKLSDPSYFSQLADIYARKYGQIRFDVLVAADDNAFFFLRDYRDRLFPGVPVVFCGVNYFEDSYLEGVEGFTGVNEEADLKGAIDVALALHPGTTNMVLITDATETGQRISAKFRELIPLYGSDVSFRILDDLEMERIQEEVARLDSGSIVLFTFFFRDRKGEYFEYYESPSLIAAKSRVPIYGAWDYSFGYGIVGGLLTSGFDQGKVAGEMVLRLLEGEPIESIPIVKKSPNRYFFDQQLLTRFGIDLSSLPKGSTLINAKSFSYLIDKVTVWSTVGGILILLIFVFFLLVNVVKRKKAEAAFLASEQNYHTLVNNLRVGVFRSSGEMWQGSYLQANRAMLSIFGFKTLEELKSIPVSAVYQNPEDRRRLIEEVIEKGFAKDQELAMKRTDGTPIVVSCTVTAQFDDNGAIKWLDGVMEDVSQRRSLEEQLRQAQKMEAVGTLAGGIAHDFNNLLTALSGYAELAKVKTSPDDKRFEYLSHIISCSEKATNLTSSLLAFSRKQIINPKVVSPSAIIDHIKPLLMRLLGERIELRISCPDTSINVLADANQIEQVLMNLASNAKDAMSGGGELLISTRHYDIEIDGFLPFSTSQATSAFAVITVADTGEGMDDTVRCKIFEPFFTTKDVGHGTGLGLSTTYGIIKQHGGEIEVLSTKGEGTLFKIYLPLDGGQVEKRQALPAATLTRGGSETILVAEDDPDVRGLIVNVLSEAGYCVIASEDGDDCIRKFNENQEEIALILSDVMMPKLNGYEAIAQISVRKPEVKVLFMSGYAADVIHRNRILDPGVEFVLKPVSPAGLLEKIRQTLDKKVKETQSA